MLIVMMAAMMLAEQSALLGGRPGRWADERWAAIHLICTHNRARLFTKKDEVMSLHEAVQPGGMALWIEPKDFTTEGLSCRTVPSLLIDAPLEDIFSRAFDKGEFHVSESVLQQLFAAELSCGHLPLHRYTGLSVAELPPWGILRSRGSGYRKASRPDRASGRGPRVFDDEAAFAAKGRIARPVRRSVGEDIFVG